MERNIAQYKALSFIGEQNKVSMAYEVKRTRAVWDPSLRIPGTERSGGWRCPTGTRYGGQITDRFGRNCGWGVARRLANEISDLGERLENVSDRRRGRRAERAAQRAAAAPRSIRERRGVVERVAGRVAGALEGGESTPQTPSRRERPPQLPKARRMRRGEARRQQGNLRDSEAARMQAEIDRPGGGASDVARRPAAPAARRRQASVAVAQEKPQRRVPTEQPVEKTPAKKTPAKKKAAGKKQPAKKVPAKKAPRRPAPPKQRPETPQPPSMRPAPRVPTPESPRTPTPPRPERNVGLGDLEFIEGAEWEDLNRIFGGEFGNEPWANIEKFQIAENEVIDTIKRRNNLLNINNINELQREFDDANRQAVDARNDMSELIDDIIDAENDDQTYQQMVRRFYQANKRAREAFLVRELHRERLRELREEQQQQVARNVSGNNAFDIVDNLIENENILQADLRPMFEAQNEVNIDERISRAEAARREGVVNARSAFLRIYGSEDNVQLDMSPEEARQAYEATKQRIEQDFQNARDAAKRSAEEMNEALRQANGDRNNNAYVAKRDEYRIKQRDLIKEAAKRQAWADKLPALEAAIQAEAAQPRRAIPDVLPEEVAAKAEKRVQDAIFERQAILADYLDARYGEGNAPWLDMTPERRQELVRRVGAGDADAKRELLDWATQMYKHDSIRGSNGKTYRTTITRSSVGRDGEIYLEIEIQHQSANGRWTKIGDSSRRIFAGGNPPYVYNSTMFIRRAEHKNSGIQTIYNQHAFMYAKAAGFDHVGVTTAQDGPYVWGRIGFKGTIGDESISRMRRQLNNFTRNEDSIIKTEEDAQIIRYLIGKWQQDNNSVRHMDFVYALSNEGVGPARKQRDAELRDWFVANMPLLSGKFNLDENLISPDPRQNSNVRRRRGR